MGKRRKNKRYSKAEIGSSFKPVPADEGRKQSSHARSYPPRNVRDSAIARILNKKPSNRSGLEWWRLGEYQVINGLLDKDEAQIISGEECLLEGALLDKPYPPCLIDLGWIHLERGSVVQAKKYFLDATKADAHSRDAWAFLGITEIATNNRDRAINAFQTAVSLLGENPHESDVETLNALQASPEIPAELKTRIKISKFSSAEISQFNQEDQAKAIRLMVDQALDTELPREQVKELLDLLCGIEYSGLSNLNRTIDVCIESIEYLDTTFTPHLYMGLAYKKLGKKVLSLESYKKCIQKNPACELAFTNIADILLEADRPREAYNYLIAFRDSGAPITSGNFYTNLGNAIAGLGMAIRDELECREKALELDSKNPKAILNYIFSLLTNGDVITAKGVMFKHKKKIVSSLGVESIIIHEKLIEALIMVTDPFGLMVMYDELLTILGSRDAAVFLVKAWESRAAFEENSFGEEDPSKCYRYPDFINELGIKCGNAGHHQYSLKCWQELQTFPGYENASWNIPVSLDAMGLHEEALEALKHASGLCTRRNTITANLLSKSDPQHALEFYIKALSEDEPFLMPVENGFALAKRLNRRDLYGDFLKALSQISDSDEKTILSSQIKNAQGFYDEACSLMESILIRGDDFVEINKLREEIKTASADLTLIGERVGDEIYKSLAGLYLLMSQYEKLSALIEAISQWDIDLDGDWRIITSIALSMQGRTQEAIETVLGMNDQPPPRLAKSFALFSSDDLDSAMAELSQLDEFEEDIDGYSFPLCLPSAFKPSLTSLYCLKNESIEQASEHAQHAIGLDPSSYWVTDIYIKVLDASCGLTSASDYLLNLHSNAPGNIKLLRRLIMSLAHESRIAESKEVIKNLEQAYGQSYINQVDDLIQLVEILSRRQDERVLPLTLPEWTCHLDTQGKKYLEDIAKIQDSTNNCTSFSLLVSRFSEYLLRQYFFLPLASLVDPSECITWKWAQNASSYLLDRTQRQPTLGDIISLIKTMAYSGNQSNPYIRMLRDASCQLPIDFRQMFSYDFVGRLCQLRDYRNCVMHAGDPSADDLEFVTRFVFGGDRLGRGEFVSCLIAPSQAGK
jgi:tetratricopeptide (TPR) repeat protein